MALDRRHLKIAMMVAPMQPPMKKPMRIPAQKVIPIPHP
jgi:hypothetical protein